MVRYEALTGHFVQIIIASGHATATDEELTHHADGQFVAIAIDDELLDIQLRTSHSHLFGMSQLGIVGSHGNLRGTIAVEDTGLRDTTQLRQQGLTELLTTGTTDPYLANGLAEVIAGEPRLPARRCTADHVDMLSLYELCQTERVVSLLLRGQHERLAVVEGRSDVLKGSIERDGRHAQYAVGIGHHAIGKDISRMSVQVVTDTLMAQHHTLGTSRRATGVDEVGQVVTGYRCCYGVTTYRTVKQFLCQFWRDDQLRLTILQYQLHTVSRIVGITRNIGSTGLQYAEERKDETTGTRQEQGHTVTLLDTTLAQAVGNAIGQQVHLLIGITGIAGHQCLVLRLLLSEVADALVEEAERCVAGCRLAQLVQLFLLLLADDGELAHLGIGLGYHALNHCHDAFGQSFCQSGGIECVVILYDDTTRLNLDVDLELRHIKLQQFLSDGFAAYGIGRQHANLIGIGNGRMETVVGSNAGKRIILMSQCLIEGFAGLLQELTDAHVADVQAQCQCVDKHTHRIGNLQVRTATAHRTEIDVAVVHVTRDDVRRSSKEQVCRGNLLTAAEGRQGRGTITAYRTDGLAYVALFGSLRQVGRYLTRTLAGLQFLGKELLGGTEVLALFSLLLVCHEVQVGIALLLNAIAVEQGTKLTDEQVGRTAVEQQVVDIHEQVYPTLGLHHLETIEGRLLQVERLHKVVLIGLQCLVGHLRDGHLHRYAVLQGLDNVVALCSEVDTQLRMLFYGLFDGSSQPLHLRTIGECQQIRNIVDGRGRILQTLEIDTRLGIGQRTRLLPAFPSGGRLGAMSVLFPGRRQEGGQYLILYSLQRLRLGQCLGIERHPVAFIDLHGELDGRYGGQTGISQHRGDVEVLMIDDTGYQVMQLLLQHVQRCRSQL